MSKPSWKDAPSYAKYMAQDRSGSWYWFENKPIWSHQMGVWCEVGGSFDVAFYQNPVPPEETLEPRP